VFLDGRNNGPFTQDDSFATNEDVPLLISDDEVLLNDLEFDGDPLRVSNMDTSNTLGTVKLNDGTFTYDSSVAFADLDEGETGDETFSCTISDGKGGAGTATR
jgi:hypothetical protein